MAESGDGDDREELERRLDAVERRLARLEGRLGASPAPREAPAAEPAPPAADADPAPAATWTPPAATARSGGPAAAPPAFPPPQRRESVSLEERLGGDLLAKAGVAVLVLGLVFFVAYAIEQGLIGLKARIVLGVATGLVVVAVADRFRDDETWSRLAMVFAGGGFALAYFCVFAAHHFEAYQAEFGIGLVADTVLLGTLAAGTAAYAVRTRAEPLLAEALALGFISAFLVTELTLFTLTYTTLMAVGVAYAAVRIRASRLALLSMLGVYGHLLFTYALVDQGGPLLTAVVLDAVAFGAFATLLPRTEDRPVGQVSRAEFYGVNAAAFIAAGVFVAESSSALPDGQFALLAAVALAGAAFVFHALDERDLTVVSGLAALAAALVWAPLALSAPGHLLAWAAALAGLAALQTTRSERALQQATVVVALVLLLGTFARLEDLTAGTQRVAALLAVAAAYAWAFTAATWRLHADVKSDHGVLHLTAAALTLLILLFLELNAFRLTLGLAFLGALFVGWGFGVGRAEPRWAGLSVFGLALGKAFLYDVWGLTVALRVVAFLVLGVALIAAAAAYTRFLKE